METKNEDLEVDKKRMRTISVPEFEPVSFDEDIENHLGGYQDLMDVELSQRQLLVELFRVTNDQNEEDRLFREARLVYDRNYKRNYLKLHDVKPDSVRRLQAELKCEDLEDEWIYHEQKRKELDRKAQTLRDALRSMMSSGNNLRQQMRT